MDLFGIGLGELLAIGIIALLVFGPAQLPEIALALARMLRQIRTASQEVFDELAQDLGPISEKPRRQRNSPSRSKDDNTP